MLSLNSQKDTLQVLVGVVTGEAASPVFLLFFSALRAPRLLSECLHIPGGAFVG